MPMNKDEAAAFGRLEATVEAQGERMDRIDKRLGELVPRGGSNGPNGRRLRDRALPLGRDGLVLALLAEVTYRIVTGG